MIGVNDWERTTAQEVMIHLDLEVDLHHAGKEDDIALTVDYKQIRDRIEAVVAQSRYYLIEALAERVAEVCLEDQRVKGVHVSLEKPGALSHVGTVGVKISRKRD